MVPTAQFGWSKGFQVPPSLGDAATSTRAGGQALLSVAPFTGPAAPFVAAAGAITSFVSSFLSPNLPKEVASAKVEEIDFDYLRPNLDAWNALPGYQRTSDVQHAAMNVFKQGWQALTQFCSVLSLGSAGVNCIKDRQRGGKYDWWKLFYDPIALDPHVAEADSLAAEAVLENAVTPPADGGATPPGQSQSPASTPAVNGSSKTGLWIGLGLLAFAGAMALGGDE